MSEPTVGEKARIFCDLARNTSPNTNAAYAAQDFFKSTLMGRPDLKGTHPSISEADRPTAQAAFLRAVETVARVVSGASFQTPVSYDTLIDLIPAKEKGIHHTLRKVGIQVGAVEPAWN